jgi:methyl-accepting chemotaxis protein
MVQPEFERGRSQPTRTGNPVVDRSLGSGREKLTNVRSTPQRPAAPSRPAPANARATELEPVRRRAAGAGDAEWKEF